MKRTFKVILSTLLVLAVLCLGAYYVATHDMDILNPKGVIAYKERDLIITALSLMLIVVIPVFFLTLIFAIRYREGNKSAKYTPNWAHSALGEAIWWGVPCIIIVILAVITYRTSHELNPFKPLKSDKRPVQVQAVALNWKWLFIYPELGIAAVNYMQIPVDRPINLEITADAPMNSFWVPQLSGQIYAMPAMRTRLHVMANEEGIYRGRSSNISGKGFAGMLFNVKASSEMEFQSWVDMVRKSSYRLNWQEYLNLVQPSEYNPVKLYQLTQRDLFDRIVDQYDPPKKKD